MIVMRRYRLLLAAFAYCGCSNFALSFQAVQLPFSSSAVSFRKFSTPPLAAKKGFGKKEKTGFGKASAIATLERQSTLPFEPVRNKGPKFHIEHDASIEQYLSPRLFEDPSILKDVGRRLREGEIVVIRDAFVPAFAEAMHRELLGTTSWTINENYLKDGYHYRHYNVYDKAVYSDFFNSTIDLLNSDKTKKFMSDLTGRDCTGDVIGSPSYYGPGDHSLPHTDHFGQRSVAYVWHLSKRWRPEWGGGLYWAQEPLANAYLHASFNSLVLFSVTPLSSHFVTTVSPHATEKRLSFNGWWQSSWEPQLSDDLEDKLATPEKRLQLTYQQYVAIDNILHDPWAPRVEPLERREKLEELMKSHLGESYPPQRSPPIV